MTFVLLIWGLFGGLILYFFLANFLTVLLKTTLEKPVNSAQDIIDRGMIPFADEGAYFWKGHLLQSPNPLYQQLGKIMEVPLDWKGFCRRCKVDIQSENTHVFLGDFDALTYWCGECGKDFKEYENVDYQQSDYYSSTEVLEGSNPYSGNILNKRWTHGDEYNHHLLLFSQVRIVHFELS